MDEDVGRFQVTVEDISVVKHLQAPNHLDHATPNFDLREQSLISFMLCYFLVQVASICVLHHDAERRRFLVEKRVLVSHDIWVFNACQNTNFIESICFLLFTEFADFYLLERVFLLVTFPRYLENLAVRTVA